MKARVDFVNRHVAGCITHLFLYGSIEFHDCFLILPAGYIKCLQTSEHFVQETNNYSQSEHMATAGMWEKRWGLGRGTASCIVTLYSGLVSPYNIAVYASDSTYYPLNYFLQARVKLSISSKLYLDYNK